MPETLLRARGQYLAVACTLLLFLSGSGCVNIRSSTDSIERQILKRAPLGSDYGEVIDLVDSSGWEISSNLVRTKPLVVTDGRYPYVSGTRIVRTHLGHYRAPMLSEPLFFWFWFRNDVSAFWGFDADDRLIEVHVKRYIDAF